MRIEVASASDTSTKEKGDLLERFAEDFVRTQNYEVDTQVRFTAVEIDLLCKHHVSGRTLYVECKAHREPLSANPLKNLLGTIAFKNYDEGWLISAGPLGKDAKGFQHEWEQKPDPERQKLSVYTPDRVIKSFVSARLVCPVPQPSLLVELPPDIHLGDWMLLITTRGRFWATTTNAHGVPFGVVALDASNGKLVRDLATLRELARMDTSLATLDFDFCARTPPSVAPAAASTSPDNVVEVQHGDRWSDYRPARPKDFVGRRQAQDAVFSLLEDVRLRDTATRVFAITGDSGMGKSSLIAKLRAQSQNRRNRKKFFLYAVDCRAATNPTYVSAALLKAIKDAAMAGFGVLPVSGAEISDHSDPLRSDSIRAYLSSLEDNNQVTCLVLDQFEELYSKPELFPVFDEAQRLFLSAVSASSSLVLGFAWRSDSTVQQDHPAYYMWHRLRDHRLEVALGPLSTAESSLALTLFEKELGEKVRPEIRRQIMEASQGYPWLLKKICIHLFEQIKSGDLPAELVETLNVRTLFERDLMQLTRPEDACLRLVARTAPADWFEVLEASNPDVLRALQDKRLVVRSGDRLNIYWDIFREYILTSEVPSIPFSYIPSAPSMDSLLRVASALVPENGRSHVELSDTSGLGQKTVGNVVRDLRMFGVATGSYSEPRLARDIQCGDPAAVLEKIRRVLKRHVLTNELEKLEQGATVTADQMAEILRSLNPSASHHPKTWMFYAERMALWLTATGLLTPDSRLGWRWEDKGRVVIPQGRSRRSRRGVFTGDAPPQRVVSAFQWLFECGPASLEEVRAKGYRNAVLVLSRFGLVAKTQDGIFRVASRAGSSATPGDTVWQAASAEESVKVAVACLRAKPAMSGPALGEQISEHFTQEWKPASKARNGNALRRWAEWVVSGEERGQVPTPQPGRRGKHFDSPDQGSLF